MRVLVLAASGCYGRRPELDRATAGSVGDPSPGTLTLAFSELPEPATLAWRTLRPLRNGHESALFHAHAALLHDLSGHPTGCVA
jgi:hypothetical protein